MTASLALARALAAARIGPAHGGSARPPPRPARAPLTLNTFPDGVPFQVTAADGQVRGGKSLRHVVRDEELRRLYILDMGRSERLVMNLDTDEVGPPVAVLERGRGGRGRTCPAALRKRMAR